MFEGEGYMAAKKEGVSGQVLEISSLVPDNTFPSGYEQESLTGLLGVVVWGQREMVVCILTRD